MIGTDGQRKHVVEACYMNERKRLSPATGVGLMLALGGYLLVTLLLTVLEDVLSANAGALTGLALAWLLAGAVLLVVRWGEQRPFTSIGLKPIGGKAILLAIGLGILLSLTVPLLTLLVGQVIPATEEGSISAVAESAPVLLLLLSVLTAGVTEEILYRGYPMERLTELTGNVGIAAVISLVAFVLPHAVGWNLAHVVGVVIPLGIVLTGLYLWQRNLIFNMIVHTLIDLPLVFIALAA
jgi:membrane protease YdiL (CAAX protease family)